MSNTLGNVFMSVDTGLAQSPPAVSDVVLQMGLDELYAGIKILQKAASDSSYFPMLASEDLLAGQFVALHNVAGVCKMRKANATDNSKVVVGWVSKDVLADTWAVVTTGGYMPLLASLTPAAFYYLSTTAGQLTATKPAAVGNIVQPIGYAISSTELIVNISHQYTQL